MDQLNALFIHGYWLSQAGKEPVKLSLRGQLVTEAAAMLYNKMRGNVYLVIAAGFIWGDTFPSIAEVMVKQLTDRYRIPKDKIIVRDIALNTKDEIEVFKGLAKKYAWKQVASLSAKKHLWTLPLLYKDTSLHPTFFAYEDILQREGDEVTKEIVKKFAFSKYEFSYALYEAAIRLVLFFDPSYAYLRKRTLKERNKKTHYGLFPFLPADKYRL